GGAEGGRVGRLPGLRRHPAVGAAPPAPAGRPGAPRLPAVADGHGHRLRPPPPHTPDRRQRVPGRRRRGRLPAGPGADRRLARAPGGAAPRGPRPPRGPPPSPPPHPPPRPPPGPPAPAGQHPRPAPPPPPP